MKFYRLAFFSITIVLLTLFSCSSDDTMNDSYPGSWRSPNSNEIVQIGKTLIRNDITVCGEYYLKKYKSSNSEFLVACTPDGKKWSYFLVFTSSQEVMITQLDNTISKPNR